MSERGYRVRVVYPILFEYRYAIQDENGWYTTGRDKGRVFPTEAEAQQAVTEVNKALENFKVEASIEPIPEFDPDWCIPPGAHLQEKIDFHLISPAELAGSMDVPITTIEGLLAGTELLTSDLASKLSAALPHSSQQYWINLEMHYRDGLRKGLRVG